MLPRTDYVYAALAIAFAVAFGLGVGPYWVDDAVALAFMALLVIIVYLSQGEGTNAFAAWWAPASKESQLRPTGRIPAPNLDYKYIPRSRIAHFVLLSRISPKSPTGWDSYNTFEQNLLNRQGWQKLSADELRAIVEIQRE
ncbi:MAG TPA: hypothetical protein VKF15_00880 [Nitrososphaerales archaeon]|nr:hypothetical protein [Nitrososphaerales archaeon]